MNTPAKLWTYGILLSGSLALYLPRFFSSEPRPSAEPVDVPAERNDAIESGAGDGAEMVFASGFEGDPSDSDETDVAGEPRVPSAADEPASAGTRDGLERALSRLDNFLPRAVDTRLDLLASGSFGALSSNSAAGTPGNATPAAPDAEERARARVRARQEAEAFLSANPLRGLLLGERDPRALLGNRSFSLGDRLPGTQARIIAIEEQGVRLECLGQELSAELPPLREGPAAATSRGAQGVGAPVFDTHFTGGGS